MVDPPLHIFVNPYYSEAERGIWSVAPIAGPKMTKYVRVDWVEMLENELATWRSVFPDIAPSRVQRDRSVVAKENARLREALAWYATGGDAVLLTHRRNALADDGGARARAVLAEIENQKGQCDD